MYVLKRWTHMWTIIFQPIFYLYKKDGTSKWTALQRQPFSRPIVPTHLLPQDFHSKLSPCIPANNKSVAQQKLPSTTGMDIKRPNICFKLEILCQQTFLIRFIGKGCPRLSRNSLQPSSRGYANTSLTSVVRIDILHASTIL